MELRQYIEIIKKNILIVILLPLAGALLAFYLSTKLSGGYQLDQTFYISSAQQAQAPDSAQNDYYSNENSRNFTDTATAIFQSLDFNKEIGLPGTISARKEAPQVIRITAFSKSSQGTKDLMEKTITVFNNKIKKLSPNSIFQMEAVGIASQPQTASLSPKIIVAVGLLTGFVVSLAVICLKTYFRL